MGATRFSATFGPSQQQPSSLRPLPRYSLYLQLLMTNLIRSANSAEHWTESELAAYHLTIVPQNRQAFFGLDGLPDPATPLLAGFMTTEDGEHATDGETRK